MGLRMSANTDLSCGVVRITGINEYYGADALEQMLIDLKWCAKSKVKHEFNSSWAGIPQNIFIWCDKERNRGGKNLADAIDSRVGFGKVVRSVRFKGHHYIEGDKYYCIFYTWIPSAKAHKWFDWETTNPPNRPVVEAAKKKDPVQPGIKAVIDEDDIDF
jgi:hypothetical protein